MSIKEADLHSLITASGCTTPFAFDNALKEKSNPKINAWLSAHKYPLDTQIDYSRISMAFYSLPIPTEPSRLINRAITPIPPNPQAPVLVATQPVFKPKAKIANPPAPTNQRKYPCSDFLPEPLELTASERATVATKTDEIVKSVHYFREKSKWAGCVIPLSLQMKREIADRLKEELPNYSISLEPVSRLFPNSIDIVIKRLTPDEPTQVLVDYLCERILADMELQSIDMSRPEVVVGLLDQLRQKLPDHTVYISSSDNSDLLVIKKNELSKEERQATVNRLFDEIRSNLETSNEYETDMSLLKPEIRTPLIEKLHKSNYSVNHTSIYHQYQVVNTTIIKRATNTPASILLPREARF